jgi:hypothetical protein
MDLWRVDLKRIVERKAGAITGYPLNLSGTDIRRSFRSVIFYFKLCPKVDVDEVCSIITYICRDISGSIKNNGNYAALFLNDEGQKLLHPKSMLESTGQLIRAVNEFYDMYSKSNEKYSGTLYELFPEDSSYPENYPSKEDLCVVFQDRRGIMIAQEIQPRVQMLQKNWISISAEKGSFINIGETI